jgi:hypothetical protein
MEGCVWEQSKNRTGWRDRQQVSEGGHAMPRKRKTNRKRLERVNVRAERRKEVDWDRFAYALLQHARILSEQEAKRGKPKP